MTHHRRSGPRRPRWPMAALPALLCAALAVGTLLWAGADARGRRPAGAVPSAAVRTAPAAELPQPPSRRRSGLPVALAVVALAGSGSLLVRTLLAEPRAPTRAAGEGRARRW